MKIAQVAAYFQPEFGYEEYYISRYLAKMGHEVSLITSDRIFPFKNYKKLLADIGSKYTTRKRGVGVTKKEGFTVYRLPMVFELFTDFNLLLNIRATLAKIQPDIVHIHEPIQGGSALAAKHKDLGYKLLVDQHGYATTFDASKTLKNWVAHRMFNLLRKPAGIYAFSRADAITAITPKSKSFVAQYANIPEHKIEVVTNGTDEDLFKFRKKLRESKRKELNLADDKILIITAGRVDPAKRLELLIHAFNKLVKNINAVLILIGSGDEEYNNKLKTLVHKLKLDDRIKFIRFVDKRLLPGYFSAADIGFWNKEAITIIEAMSTSLPVVLPDQDTVKQYVTNKNGLIFPDGDSDAIFENLLQLSRDKQLRLAMGKRGAELVRDKFSYNVTAKKYLEIYKRILNQ